MKKMSKKKKIIIGVVGVAVLGFVGHSLFSGMSKEAPMPTVVTADTVQEDLQTYIDTTGTVESRKIKTYFSPVNAKIASLSLEEGSLVTSGEKILEYDLENLEKNNQKATLSAQASKLSAADTIAKAGESDAKVAKAAAELPQLEAAVANWQSKVNELLRKQDAETSGQSADTSGIATTTSDIAAAEANLGTTSAAYSQAVADKEKLQNDLELAKSQNNPSRVESLVQSLNTKVDEVILLEQKKSQLEKQIASLKESLAGLQANVPAAKASVETTIALQEAQAKLAEVQAEVSSRKSLISGASISLTGAARQQLSIDSNLKDLEVKDIQELIEEGKKGITADLNGVITSLKVTQGADVAQGQELFTVSSLDDVVVRISINKSDLEKIREGQAAKVEIAGKTYEGVVESISRVAQKNEKGISVLSGIVKISNPDDAIYLGVDTKVKITGEKVASAIVIPTEAVNISNEGTFVYVLRNGLVAKQNVVTGLSTTSKVVIKEGLKVGDEVITDIGGLTEGAPAQSQEAVGEK